MIGPFLERPRSQRSPLAGAVLGLWCLVALTPAGRADDPPERLTPEQRQELERQGGRTVSKRVSKPISVAELTTAVEETRKSVRLFEHLYSRIDYPNGHPDLATSLNNLGHLLEAQGTTAGRGILRAGAGDAPGPLPQGSLSPAATPTWPPA